MGQPGQQGTARAGPGVNKGQTGRRAAGPVAGGSDPRRGRPGRPKEGPGVVDISGGEPVRLSVCCAHCYGVEGVHEKPRGQGGRHPAPRLHIDADGQTLGRLATHAHRPAWQGQAELHPVAPTSVTTSLVTNCARSGSPAASSTRKQYVRYSGYPGDQGQNMRDVREAARRGRVPRRARHDSRTRPGSAAAKKLRVYAGAEHPHEAPEAGDPSALSQAGTGPSG